MRIKFKILILTLIVLSGTVLAQVPSKPLTAEEQQKIWGNDSVANKMADKIINDNLNMFVSDKLDSLVNTWYIKNSFSYNKT